MLSTLSGAYGPVDTSAPTTTIACNAAPCAGTYSGVVSVTLAATDTGTGVSSTHYTLDGSDPTPASPTYTGAFNVNGTTVKFRSWDAQGNAEAVQTQVIQAPQDTAPPTTTISCNAAACGTDPYLNSVTIGLTPTDTGGSGVDKTYYTTNGSTPTTSSTVYSAPFQVTALGNTTVKFFSTDKAGNAEAVQSQQVTVVPATTRVALEFDNSSISLYSLGYQQALQPHGAKATFFVQSGSVLTNPGAGATQMSWAQLGTLAAAGNDIGGKSTSSTNLTNDADPTTQVCDDRAAILSHGLTPVGFAYPGGASNATVQGIVKGCGYGNARGITSGTESLPPVNWFATKANAPGTVTLANMQAAVNAAATNGGLVQLVISRVCDNTLDSANYTACTAASGHVELSDLNSFLDWMGNAGQAGGAPAGAALSTLSAAYGPVDTSAPTTTIACNAAACASTPYSGVVSVTLAATDTGTGVSSTHYTLDGSDPTLASPTYTGAFNVNGAAPSTTVKFRSWDYKGNVEAVQTQVIQAPQDTVAPTTAISCNSAACSTNPYVASVTIGLTPADTGGSGVDKTYYTTDGSTPTTSSTVYSAPFQVTALGNTTVQFFSTDKAGNAEAVQSQQVTIVPVATRVALTFDNGTVGQYTLGYLKALQPHNAKASFYVNSTTIGVSGNSMSWAQLTALAAAGNDIGGKTNAANLTTDPDPTSQICNDRAALVQHGLDPVGLAWPGGASNQTVKDIAKGCGYGIARSAGSLSPTGPTYAEKLPPNDWYATRAWAPSGQVTLANMEALVTGAASHGGGLSQIVITRVCSQTEDPGGYATCTTAAGWIELDDLNSFLDWMGNAGQNGGAPAGAVLSTVRDAAISADTIKPSSTATCNGAACTSNTYTQTVYVTLSGTDVGSAVQSIRYTTDGSTPTTSSTAYTRPIPITSTTTLTWRAFDHAGNAEDSNSVTINANLPPDSTPPTTTIVCDGTPCGTGGYNGSTTVSLTAVDGNGWGVDQTYYTTDGSDPIASSADVYSTPFKLTTGTYTVKWFSTDLAGNVEAVQSQQIVVLDPRVVVSLTFDDGLLSQYALGDKLALKPHGLRGTFFDVTGLHNDEQHMTWKQLTDLNNDGNEIGAHTVNHVSLKGLPVDQATSEACGSYNDLVAHGFYPTSFAYPTGAYDAQAESVVQSCGFTSGRAAGGIDVAGEGLGPVYAESLPPKDPFALRTLYDQPDVHGGVSNVPPLTLAHLEAAVNGAASHGGGWVPLVFHEICSQQYDPDNYTFCINDWGPIELTTLNQFFDWLKNSRPAGWRARAHRGGDRLRGDERPGHPGTDHGAGLQRLAVRDVQLPRLGDGQVRREGPRWHRRQGDVLHDRRVDADHLEPAGRPPVHDQQQHDVHLLLGGQQRQHRGRADVDRARRTSHGSDRGRGR